MGRGTAGVRRFHRPGFNLHSSYILRGALDEICLDSGASVAEATLAWWLRRCGSIVTLIDRIPGPARGGHAIDVHGAALDVLRAMGIRHAVYDERLQMEGVSIIDESGKEVWRSEEMTISGGKFDNEDIEVLRDKLSRGITSNLPKDIEVAYHQSIASLKQHGNGVDVAFANGDQQRFDFVVGADGLRSNVRNLIFGQDREFLRSFNVALAPFSVPNTLGLNDWQISYRETGGEGYMVYTTPDNSELRVCFGMSAMLDTLPTDRATQMACIREHCGGLGWETSRFLDAMETPDFYQGLIARVLMVRWSEGGSRLWGMLRTAHRATQAKALRSQCSAPMSLPSSWRIAAGPRRRLRALRRKAAFVCRCQPGNRRSHAQRTVRQRSRILFARSRAIPIRIQ